VLVKYQRTVVWVGFIIVGYGQIHLIGVNRLTHNLGGGNDTRCQFPDDWTG